MTDTGETSFDQAALQDALDRYSLTDPAAGNADGVFVNTDIQMLYDSLIARGTPSLLDGLYVGVLIEELDIFDLERLLGELDDNPDITLLYENLQKGSRNHLRAFNAVNQLRILGRWMRMITIPNQSSVARAFLTVTAQRTSATGVSTRASRSQ